MDYPEAVKEKAKRLEQLLLRVEAGESLEEVNQALGVKVGEEQLVCLRDKYEAGGRKWEALLDGRWGHAQKIHSGILEWLYARKDKDNDVRAPQLAREIEELFGVKVDPGHINYLLRKRGLTAPTGRPRKKQAGENEETEAAIPPSESIENAGIFFPGGSEDRHGSGGGGGEKHPRSPG